MPKFFLQESQKARMIKLHSSLREPPKCKKTTRLSLPPHDTIPSPQIPSLRPHSQSPHRRIPWTRSRDARYGYGYGALPLRRDDAGLEVAASARDALM